LRLPKGFTGYDRRVWILFYGRIIASTGFSVVMPFLALYLNQGLGVSMTLVGLVLLISSSVGAIGQLVGGELADRIGRKPVMYMALYSRALVMGVIALAVSQTVGYEVIALLVTMTSFLGSMYEPATNALIADVVEPSKRLEAYGLLRIGGNLGWSVGPALGGFMAVMGFPFLFIVAGLATSIVATMIMLLVTESMRPGEKHDRFRLEDLTRLRKDVAFLGFCIVSVFLFMNFGQMSSTMEIYSIRTVGIDATEVGYLFAENGLMVVFLQFPIARYISRFRITSVIAAGSFMYAVGYFLIAFSTGFAWLFGCMFIITMGEMVVSPSTMNLTAKLSPERERGRYMGIFGLFTSIGSSFGPFAGGVLMDGSGANHVLLWSGIAIFGVIAGLGYLVIGRAMGAQLNTVEVGRHGA
jgi:MFS family permease